MYRHTWLSFACCLALLACGGEDPPDSPDASAPGIDAAAGIDAAPQPDSAPEQLFTLQFVDPDHGAFSGGTEVLVRGNGFDENTVVLFGGRTVEPLDYEFIDSRRILVRTPPGEPGPADVQVQNGNDVVSLAEGYEYEPIKVDPPAGSVAGGTLVTIVGLGTDFGPGSIVNFDGLPLVDVNILGDQQLTGYTPVGTAGTANVEVITSTAVYEAKRAYTYQATGDPFFGGMSGGPIQGSLNVVVIDDASNNGVPGALVSIGDPATSQFQGLTDNLGQITFSDPSLTGPVTVVAAAEEYETSIFVDFDAENISIFLRKPPEPFNGPLPPAPQTGRVYGHVLFGDATSLGSPHWDLVPEPRTPTERKRLYVTTTSRSMFGSPYAPTRFIDYEYDPEVIAWEFDVWARPSATALVAVAGLYDPDKDPSGVGTSGFEPFAMGVTRGVLIGPGETVIGQDVVVNIPLDSALYTQLDNPPALDTPGYEGPHHYKIRPFVDLGGEGVILMNKNGLPTPPSPEPRPNHYYFEPGETSILLGGMAPLVGPISDASYGFIVGAYADGDTNPYSSRVLRGYSDMSSTLTVGDYIGTPRHIDPAPAGVASGMRLSYLSEGPATGDVTFHLHLLTDVDGVKLARIITRGDVYDVDIPDLTSFGLPAFPGGVDVNWTVWSLRIPGATFDQFTYRQLSSLYWEAYAVDSALVQFPTP